MIFLNSRILMMSDAAPKPRFSARKIRSSIVLAPVNSISSIRRKIRWINKSANLANRLAKKALINSHTAATMAWRDEMQGATCSQGLFSLISGATRQFARKAPSHMGCNQIARSLRRPPWHRSLGYDLRRSTRDHRDLVCNAARGGVNQRFLSDSSRSISSIDRSCRPIKSRHLVIEYAK